ncbi:MAG: hypothetical protein OEW97_05965, partial [Gammaproteobacteria bacterium]|nr:hypothetical protein [Gammaproteobacteria bacterium]
MNQGHFPFRPQVVIVLASAALFFGNFSHAHAFSLANEPAQSLKIPDTHLIEQRALFLKAEKAIKLGQINEYHKIEYRLKDYPLYPYLRFADIERRLARAPTDEIQTFLLNYHNTPLANKLYYRWIRSLAKHGKNHALIQYFRPTQNTQLLCHYAGALYQANKKGEAFSLMGELWLTDESLPKSCDPLLKQWTKAGYMTTSRIWARIHLAMNNGKRRLATYLSKSLPKEERFWLSLWKKVQRQPDFVLEANQHFKDQHSPIMHWILVDGMTRLARRQPLVAAGYWKDISQKYHFTDDEKERIERRLSLSLARAATPLSRSTLKELKLDSKDTRVITPHILSSIADKDWDGALAWLNHLKSNEQNSERWHYWRARTLEEMGRLDEARSLYVQITDNRSYYSFLAADRIGDRYQLTHRAVNAPAAELSKLQHIPAIA